MWLKNKTKLFRKRFFHRCRMFFHYRQRKMDIKDPVFVISDKRTGSHVLLDCLNSIPGVSFAAEILNPRMFYGLRRHFISKKSVQRHIVHSIHDSVDRIRGAKFLRGDLEAHGISLPDLKSLFPKARFIILYRRSLLDQFISLKIAEATGLWLWTKDFRLPGAFYISSSEFQAYCWETKAFYVELFRQEWLRSCSLALSYEDLVEDTQGVFEGAVCPFLGMPFTPVHHGMVKQNTKEPRQMIENYDEIACILHSPIAWQEYTPRRQEKNIFLETGYVA